MDIQIPDFYQMMHVCVFFVCFFFNKSLILLTAVSSLLRPVGVVVGGILDDCCYGNVLIDDSHNAVELLLCSSEGGAT